MNWFEQVFGFREEVGFEAVKSKFQVSQDDEGNILLSTTTTDDDGRTFHVGRFETPSLQELRQRQSKAATTNQESCSDNNNTTTNSGLVFQHIVADVNELHTSHPGAVFQAASQFNCLEMVSPQVTPEDGITEYVHDHTQGPVCAMACPAGTLYRNYFVDHPRLDTLKNVGTVVGNPIIDYYGIARGPRYWRMQNGYALPAFPDSMSHLSQKLHSNSTLAAAAMAQLRVGVHWNTEVGYQKDPNDKQLVTQVYCSALPVAYDRTASSDADWAPFATLILEGAYEATLAVGALLARERQARVSVYLTMLGGGAFGNRMEWIRQAMERALELYRDAPLDVYLVHYGRLSPDYSTIAYVFGKPANSKSVHEQAVI